MVKNLLRKAGSKGDAGDLNFLGLTVEVLAETAFGGVPESAAFLRWNMTGMLMQLTGMGRLKQALASQRQRKAGACITTSA
jgi:hypothetical protein